MSDEIDQAFDAMIARNEKLTAANLNHGIAWDGYEEGLRDGRRFEREAVVKWLSRNRDDYAACMAAFDIDNGDHIKGGK